MMELQPEGQTFKVNSFDSTRAAFILFVHLSTKPVDYKTIAPAKTQPVSETTETPHVAGVAQAELRSGVLISSTQDLNGHCVGNV